MDRTDADIFVAAELAQGYHVSVDKYLTRLRDAAAGECIALSAEFDGEPAGYINVYFGPHAGPFTERDICCIVDFGVLDTYRRRGVGSALMDAAEAIAAGRGDEVCLGVGLHSGYGSAQRMYVKRGYIPDGSGVWFNDAVCPPYAACENNDDLILHMSKRLH
jgi:GNAT superfamily N-acetyltransferase